MANKLCVSPRPLIFFMQDVLDYLKLNQATFISDLCEFLRFPSVSAQPQHNPDMIACAEWLANHCRKIGLETKVHPTDGHPIVVAKTARQQKSSRPHFMVYGHYDVQPPEPLDLWKSPPFEPRIAGRSLFARGSTDNKGQHFAHLKAVEAYLKTGTPLPCDLTFVIEGEEEVGSKHLAQFLKANRPELDCDAVVVSDTGMPEQKSIRLSRMDCAGSSLLKSLSPGRRETRTPAVLEAWWIIRRWRSANCSANCVTKTDALPSRISTMT